MKKYILKLFPILALLFFMSFSSSLISQPPPPPSGTNDQNNKLGGGGGAPIGSGLFILLGLGAAYGARKIYQLNKESLEE